MSNARDFLQSVRDAILQQERLRERLTMAADRMNGVGGMRYSDMPKNPNASMDGVFNAVNTYQKIVEMLDEWVGFSAMLVDAAWEMLVCMRADGCDTVTVDVLEWYYIWCLDDDAIADKLGKSKSRVRHMRTEMVTVADRYVPLYAA